MMVQWLRLCAPNAVGSGSIPSQGTRPHMLQLRLGEAKSTTTTKYSKIPFQHALLTSFLKSNSNIYRFNVISIKILTMFFAITENSS